MPDEKPEILAAADKKIEKVMKNFNRGLISDEERYRKTVEIWQAATEEVSEALSDNLKKNHQRNPIYMMSDSAPVVLWTRSSSWPVCAACWPILPVRRWRCLSAPTTVRA